MRERKKSLERLLAVQIQLAQLEEVRLAEIERQRAKVCEDRQAMFGFLDGAAQKDPLLARLACRRVVAAERGAAALDMQVDAQRRVLLHRNAQRRCAERRLAEAATALERAEEKQTLLEIAERLGASLTPACGKP